MLDDQRTTSVIIAIVVIVGLEVWRRSLRHRTARWVHVATLALLAIVAGGVAYTQWALTTAFSSVTEANPADKATLLAQGISRAMNCYALAIAAALVAMIVLGVATLRARRTPVGDPIAETIQR